LLPERAFDLAYWTEEGHEKENLLYGVVERLLPRKYLIALDQGWNGWDLEICQGPWAKARMKSATENHGGTKRLLRVRCSLRMSGISVACLWTYSLAALSAMFLDMPNAGIIIALIGALHAAGILHQHLHLGQALYHVVESVAHRLRLMPLGQKGADPTP
jgi:hypothetical protein